MSTSETSGLRRHMSKEVLALYGLGTILGAGIYVVIGKVAGPAGALTPLAFLAASVAALLTAASYAELGSRIPESGGSAAFIDRAFRAGWLTGLAGWALIATGIVSAATIASGFVGYLNVFVPMSAPVAIIGLMAILTGIAVKGIKESAIVMALTTLLEVGGLFMVIAYGWSALPDWPALALQAPEGAATGSFAAAIFGGAFLAFYAFIGFEDMVVLGEEVRDPARSIPFAVFAAVGAALVIYLLVAAIAVTAIPLEALQGSDAPLSDLVEARGGPGSLLAGLGLFTIVNGGLAQVIMASRVMHDLGSRRGVAPPWLARINPRTGTPVRATLLAGAVVAFLAIAFPLVTLASITSLIVLVIFAGVNLALIVVRRRADVPPGAVRFPLIVPAGGLLSCLALLVAQLFLA